LNLGYFAANGATADMSNLCSARPAAPRQQQRQLGALLSSLGRPHFERQAGEA